MPFSNTNATRTTASATASDATRLRVLAGTPHSRRGSVLVLVVGVLALLAIIIVVYTSVGQADVRGGRTLVNQARLDDQSNAISDYIRLIVGNDASAVKVQPISIPFNSSTVNVSVRERSDYPYTDPYSKAQLTGTGLTITDPYAARFDPAGNITSQWTGTNLDPRVTSDPFLASGTPTWVNRNYNSLPPMPTPFALMGHQRDWAHMSLVSPSGLPVNLANLRGNWTAPSGFPLPRQYATTGPLMMSDWLYTWSRASDNAGYMATPIANQSPGVNFYNSPAHWSNDCTETFRPVTWNPNKHVMGDVKFMGNMLGDADGDGFYDSRWQELVDVSDPTRPVNLLPGGTGGGVRWFVAPRIIDLSGMVNINTATSFAVPPDAENPAGLTPSDVDLERLLTTADARQYFGIDPSVTYVSGGTYGNAQDITTAGRWAFTGILEGRASGLVETVANRYVDSAGTELNAPVWLRDMGVQRTGNGPALGSITRKMLYTLGGKDEADGQLRTAIGATNNPFLKQPGGYGIGDEHEFRAFGAVNEPGAKSRAEATSATMAAPGIYALMNPLRPDRDLTVDRDAGLLLGAGSTVTVGGEQVPRAFAQYFSDVRHDLTTTSGSRPFAYTLPTLPLTAGQTAARPITDLELRLDINTLLQKAIAVTPQGTNNTRGIYPLTAANTIFSNYALALSPFLGSVGLGNASQSLWLEATPGANQRNLALSFGGVTYKTATTGTDVGEIDTPKFKGRAPEIAVRSAAHTAINLMASRDNTNANNNPLQQPDGRLLAATVLLDEGQRALVASGTYPGAFKRFPYWQAGANRLGQVSTPPNALGTTATDIKAYTFDLNGGQPGTVQRLAGATGSPEIASDKPYAVNVFAAQPQPFITAAVAFDMYYDAPDAAGGDSMASSAADIKGEWYVSDPGDPGNGVPPTIESLGITIKGDVSLGNPDFLMEAIAFQITNPFDVTLTLGDNTGAFAYYFEFAGNFYDARAYDDNGNRINTAVQIGPRQSMCFYALSQKPSDVQSRWNAADPSIGSLTSGGETPLSAWVKKQMQVTVGGGAVVRTVPIDRANGQTASTGQLHKILASSATSDDNKVVKLWRVVLDRPSGEVSNANKAENDYLVDRIHEPTFGNPTQRSALFRRMNTDYNRFTGIGAGPEPGDPLYQGPAVQRENIGYAITMFGEVRRRTDPTGGPLPGQNSDANTGVMPAWCVEARNGSGFQAPLNARNVVSVNDAFPDSSVTTGISPTDFTGHNWSARSFRNMLAKGIGRQYTSASRHPATRTGSGAAGSGPMGDDPADKIGLDIDGVDWIAGGKAVQLPVYPRRNTVPTEKDVQLPPLRPADLLMPWAIGPYQYGHIDAIPANDDFRHTTLSEAIAMGLNYSRGTDDKTYEFQIGQVLDRCHLPTDRYVPFNDANSNGEWNYNTGNADPSISNGIPFALNVLDRFRTTRYGTIDSVMPGQININTASLNALRMLPFLTPASQHIFGTDNAGLRDHWMNSTASPFSLTLRAENGTVANQSLWAANQTWDVAATLIAYRDQMAVVARGRQDDETGTSRTYIDFSRGTATVTGNDGNRFNTAAGKHTGRAFMNNVVNARQEMGFATPGEIMLAVIQDATDRTGTQNVDDVRRNGIDRMAEKLNANGTQSVLNNFEAPVAPIININGRGLPTGSGPEVARSQAVSLTAFSQNRRVVTGTGEHFVQGGKSSDYDRKIAIANALLNTVSTSSDLYCAYFLVNGYTEGDTQGLETYTGNGTPSEDRYTRAMTPSIQRRYMMVLDRSACVRSGDKPKVLMFEELPVN